MEEIIFRHFPDLTETQKERISGLYPLYLDWNGKINVISRKDIDKIYLHHVLHSLAIAKYRQFEPGSTILDVGTGGGFPGIPLAILFPECKFTLCDSIGKKIKVAGSVAQSLGLDNVTAVQSRAEDLGTQFDYIVSRAVTELKNFYPWVRGYFSKSIIYLKGGDLTAEMEGLRKVAGKDRLKITVSDINQWFEEEFFEEKKIIEIEKELIFK